MVDYSDAVVIVAALIQSGQFKLVDSNRAERQALADVIDANDWRMVPALVALRKPSRRLMMGAIRVGPFTIRVPLARQPEGPRLQKCAKVNSRRCPRWRKLAF